MEKLLANTLTLANIQRNKQNLLRKYLLKYIPKISTIGKKALQFVFPANIPPFSGKKVSNLIQLKPKLKEWLTKTEKLRLKFYRIL